MNVSVEKESEFKQWLPEKVQERLQIDGFLKATVDEITDPVSENLIVICRYYLRSELDLFDYLEINAPLQKEDEVAKFGNTLTTTTRIFKQLHQFRNDLAIKHPHQRETLD